MKLQLFLRDERKYIGEISSFTDTEDCLNQANKLIENFFNIQKGERYTNSYNSGFETFLEKSTGEYKDMWIVFEDREGEDVAVLFVFSKLSPLLIP